MIDSGLVYIHYAESPAAFAGCGALVEGAFIVTCRHVWEQAVGKAGDSGAVYICFPAPPDEGEAKFKPATLVDSCTSLGSRPDLVILLADVPAGISAVVLARGNAPQHGPGYVIAGLRRNGPGTPVRDVIITGNIGARIDGSGLRLFTSSDGKGHLTDLGFSGSPLLLESTDELAGIVSLSETGFSSGAAQIREAFAVPASTIHRYLSHYVGREAARAYGVDEAKIPQILDTIGAGEIGIAELRRRLRMYFETLQAPATREPTQSDHGADIDSAIEKSRSLSAAFQPADAMAVLDHIIAEETALRRQRLVPLLEEKAIQHRRVFDHEGAKATLRELLVHDPDRVWRWIDLGDICLTTGALQEANVAFQQALDESERLIQQDHSNAEWRRALSVSHNRIGDVQHERGNLTAALISYQTNLAIVERLAETDPGNTEWQRALSVSHNRIGDVEHERGDLTAALKSYQSDLSISERLVQTDSTNTQWQRDLSVSHNKIGDVQAARLDAAAALDNYSAAVTIAELLAKADPTNTEWQRGLAVSHERIGELQRAQGDAHAALSSYHTALAIAERLAQTDPTNIEWQRDLAVSLGKVAVVEAQQRLRFEALERFRRGRDIIARLQQKSPEYATLPKDLAWFNSQIDALEKSQH